jgi:hypothetical protein
MTSAVAINLGETIQGASTNIIGNGPILANMNSSTQLFAPGQIVASLLGPNMGQVTIQSAPTAQVLGTLKFL